VFRPQHEPPEGAQTDRCQGSRYGRGEDENGKITPSVEVVVRLAELFNVTTDYLLIDGAPGRTFKEPTDPLADRLTDLATLDDADRAALTHILDGLLANTRIRAALNTAS
jgi:hypothetical protein